MQCRQDKMVEFRLDPLYNNQVIWNWKLGLLDEIEWNFSM